MTTFAASAKTSSSPLFAMFPPTGGTPGMKGFAFAGMDDTVDQQTGVTAASSDSSAPVPPLRPSRHMQHAAQWSETKTLGAGLVVHSTTATVSQWSEFQQTTEISRSTQYQTIRTQTVQSSSSSAGGVLTPAQYLDDLQLDAQQLDVGAQLVKSSMGRKGSLGGRRPPTVKMRRSSHLLLLEQPQDVQQIVEPPLDPTPAPPPPVNTRPWANQQTADPVPPPKPAPPFVPTPTSSHKEGPARNGPVKIPPPRPPPPVFSRPAPPEPHPPTPDDWSRSATPPSLPPNSPPPLPIQDELDFVLERTSTESSSASATPVLSPRHSVMTDVVEINDKESIDDEGEVVRRRTIITLGQKLVSGGSSGSINVTLLNSPAEAKKEAEEESPRPVGRASAFNARRTIELRRQQQHLDNNPIRPAEVDEPPQPEPRAEPELPLSKTPSATYLFGEMGSPASSFGGSSLRTVSISMSFDDLESNASEKKGPGRNRSEAWYERRQSYGFEAADKLQSLLNTSGSSDVPSTGAISRSCDSLSSTVRSTSSQIEKMIPPWLKSPARPTDDDEVAKTASRMSYFGESMDDVVTTNGRAPEKQREPSPPPVTPTPSIQRSESSRSASNLTESEPAWLRDLKMRRSLRDNRRTPPVRHEPNAETPVWLNVKLRPTGLNLVDADPAEEPSKPSPTKPALTPIFTFVNTKQTSKLQQHLRNSLENILDNNNTETSESNESQSKENNNNQVRKSSSVVIVNSSRESLHSDSSSVKSAPVESSLSNRLNHHRSIELMRMLEETPLVTANGVNYDRTETGSVFTDATSVYSMGDESFASVKNSSEDLAGAQSKKKKVAFGADVKEESDRGRSRPRRIRSRSPETRLRQWQEKLEEVKSFHSEVTATVTTAESKPLRHFGDDEKPEAPASTAPSDTFKSLLQPRSPYVIEPVKESVVIDSYPLMRASSGPADVMRNVRNGIVNFDSSVERKIVILETENAPAPKSILKKRSLENLLEPANQPLVAHLPHVVANAPLIATTITPAIHSGIKVSITNQKKEPVVIEQQVRPWRIHLKHVDPPLRIKSPDRDVTPEPWKADIARKKTPPFKSPDREMDAPTAINSKIAALRKSPERDLDAPTSLKKSTPVRSGTPENFFRGRSPSTASDCSSIPGMQAAELIRNLRNAQPVMMMVARCEVKESAYKQPADCPSAKADHGYHSLEPEAAECGSVKRNEFKVIDETIAKLNETIEEIRSVNVLTGSDNPLVIREAPEKVKTDNRFFVREIRPSRSATKVHPIVDGHIPTITPIRIREPIRSASLGSQPPINSPNFPLRRHSSGTCTPPPAPPTEPVRKFSSATNRASAELHISAIQPAQPEKVSELKSSTVQSTFFQSTTTQVTQPGAVRTEAAKPGADAAVRTTTPLRCRRSASRSPSPVCGRPPERAARLAAGSSQRVVTAAHSGREPDVQPEKASGSQEALHHVKDLVHTFEGPRPERSKSFAECGRKASTESLRSVSSVSSVSSCGRLRSTIQSMQRPFSSAPCSPAVANKAQPVKKEKPVELTSGMPEDKAAIIIRKYFGTASVIETTKSRMAETIHEEASDISSTIADDKRLMKITEVFDSEDFFNEESGTELMSSSSFGSALDNLESTDDDRASVTTATSSKASSTTVTSMRYSSCSERSVKLSDIINRPDKPTNNLEPGSTSTSIASGSMRSTISRQSSTTSTSSSTTCDNRNGSVRRNKPRRHPTVIKKEKGLAKETPKSPKAPARTRASASNKADHQAATVTAPPRRLSPKKANAKAEVSSSTAPSVRPLRPVQPPSPVKKPRSSTATSSRATAISSAKVPSASAKTPSTAKTVNDRRVSSTSNGVHATAKSNKLVTITSYNSRGVANKPEEAVSGIKVTPVAVGSGHYKIRMEQRLSAVATSSGAQKIQSSSQRTQKITTTSSAAKRTATSSTTRKTKVISGSAM